ncbi:MAG: peptide-methionine (S)-S-oxide reductase MsrA [Holophagae bacterium]|jgi:methionine-S-sulfoxide reductase
MRSTTTTPYSSFRLGAALVACAALALVVPTGTATAYSEQAEASVTTGSTRSAILAGGCFWGMEQLLRTLDGVVDTEVGYIAAKGNPKSKPAEAVRIEFDPRRISYEELLRYYFRIHDPTTMNRQGNDRGAQYRSAIFVLDDEQRAVAERVRADVDASAFWTAPLVTEIATAGKFKVAEAFHQDYLVKNPGGYTCHYERTETQR